MYKCTYSIFKLEKLNNRIPLYIYIYTIDNRINNKLMFCILGFKCCITSSICSMLALIMLVVSSCY